MSWMRVARPAIMVRIGRTVLALEGDLDLLAIDLDVARDHVDEIAFHRFDDLGREREMIGHEHEPQALLRSARARRRAGEEPP